jgi:two-component system, sensor histidine kinase
METPQSILVVEDNPTEQRVLTLLLTKFGYEITIAGTGSEAIRLATDGAGRYSAILMDWQMNDMDGLECTRRIRALQEKRGSHIPIIAVTARAMLGDKQKCLNAGMDDYLSKPYTAIQLENILHYWTSKKDKSLTG